MSVSPEKLYRVIRRRVAFASKQFNEISHVCVAFVFGSGAIVYGSGAIAWPSLYIVLASAVDWILIKFGATFVRTSKNHIRVSIGCQLRDSVIQALPIDLI